MPDQPDPTTTDPGTGATPDPVRKESMSDVTFSDRDALVANNANLRKERAQLRNRVAELEKQVTTVTAERDDYAANLERAAELLENGDPEVAAKLADLESQLAEAKDPAGWKDKYEAIAKDFRTARHREAFMKAAKAAGLRDDAMDDAWSLSGYEAEEDEPDAEKLSSVIEGLIKPRPYWLGNAKADPDGSTAPAPDGAPTKPVVTPRRGPGLERGGQPPRAEDAAPSGNERPASKRDADPFRIA